MKYISLLILALGTLSAFAQGTTPTARYQTVAEMVAATIQNVAANSRLSAFAAGRVTANDGGGGVFFFVPASVTTTNFGTVFPSTGVAGRWFREYSGALNVLWYGSLANAVTSISTDLATLEISSSLTLTAATTIPTNINLRITRGGMVINSTFNLVINGQLDAGSYKIFESASTGTNRFGAPVNGAYPQWWGALGHLTVNSAVHSLRSVGGMIWLTESAEFTSPINATGTSQGIIFQGICTAQDNGSTFGPVLTAKNTEGLFDCTGSHNLTFNDLKVTGDAVTTPKYGFLLARTAAAGSDGNHRFYNVNSEASSKFSVAVVYSYASEVNQYVACDFKNTHVNAKCVVLTQNNINSVTSTYQTIATGTQSNSTTFFYGGSLVNSGGGTADLMLLDATADLHIYGMFWYNLDGRSYVYSDTVNGASSHISIDGIRGEVDPGNEPTYGFYFGDTVRTVTSWSIVNSQFSVLTDVLRGHANVSFDNMFYRNIDDANAAGVTVTTLSNSEFYNAFLTVSGTGTANTISGASPSIATRARDQVFDSATGTLSTRSTTIGFATNGRVGAGNTSPTNVLDVLAVDDVIRLVNTGTDSVPGLVIQNDAKQIFLKLDGLDSDKFKVRFDGTDRIIMTTGGLFGYNQTPTYFFDLKAVDDNVRFLTTGVDSTPGLVLQNDVQSVVLKLDGADLDKFKIRLAGTDRVTITPAGAIDLVGDVKVTGTLNSASIITSGTYAPALFNVANLDPTPTSFTAQYSRVGNTVTVSGKVLVNPTTTLTLTQLGISLPIASALTQQEQCSGTAAASGIASQSAAIRGDATNDRAEMTWIATDVTDQPMYFSFTYLIQ